MSERIEVQKDQLKFQPGFLPLDKITEVYGLSRAYLYKLRYERRLFHYTLGARTFIDVVELETLIRGGKK